MSEQTKVYAPISAKQVTFQSGKSILKIGINVEKFSAFLKQHANAKGYVNLGISQRKEVSQYGETHTVWLDTWEPDASRAPAEARTTAQPQASPPTPKENDDVPF
jgi:hypothetical protein